MPDQPTGSVEVATIPQSVWQGTFTVFGLPIKCHVLDNGQRVIEEESFAAFMEALLSQEVTLIDRAELDALVRWQRGC